MAKLGKILLAVAEIAAIVAVSIYAPQIGASIGLSAFVSTAIGSIVVSLAFTALSAILFRPSVSPDPRVNVRIDAPPRWICGGRVAQGGGVVFGDFDKDGNLWYIIVHADSILSTKINYYFDGVLLALDGTGDGEGFVTTNDFCLTNKGDPYTGSGTRVPYFYIWTRTFTETNPVPPVRSRIANRIFRLVNGRSFASWYNVQRYSLQFDQSCRSIQNL